MEPNWKRAERCVAAFFGARRTPLSGSNSGHTGSDTLHPALFVETKYRKRFAAVSLWDETAVHAKREGKVPVVALVERGRPGFWICVKAEDLAKLQEAMR